MQKRDGGIKHTHTQPRTYCSRARTWRERVRKGEWRDLSFWTRGQEGQACQEPHGRTDKCVEHAAASSQWWLVMIKLVKVLVPHMYVTLKQTNKQNISSFKPGLYPGSPQESPDKASWSEMYLFIYFYSYRSKQSDLIRHSNPITSVAYVRLPQTRLSKHFLKQKISSISVIMKDLGGKSCWNLSREVKAKFFGENICIFDLFIRKREIYFFQREERVVMC